MFIADLGFSYRVVGDGLAGEMALTDELRSPGSERPSTAVLATVADVVAGALATESTAPRIALTSDLSVRDVRPARTSRIAVRAGILKAGSGGPPPFTDLDVRYLATIRIGPARTTATRVSDSTARVEIRDAGNPGRLASLAIGSANPHEG